MKSGKGGGLTPPFPHWLRTWNLVIITLRYMFWTLSMMELFVKNLLTIFAKRLYHRSLYAPKYTSTGFVCSFASFQSKRIDKSLKILSWGCFLGELFWQISQYSHENLFSDNFELSNFDLTKYAFSGGSLVEHLLNALNKQGNYSFRISPVHVNKSTKSCGYVHIYWRNLKLTTLFCV